MRFMLRILVLAIFVACSLSFASMTSYTQVFDASGASTMTETSDLSLYLQTYPQGALGKITDACSLDATLGCSVSGNLISITLDVPQGGGYYTATTEYGAPFVTTTVTVTKIPRDLFDSALTNVLNSAGLTASRSYAKPIDLTDKDRNMQLSQAWSQFGTQISYTAVMPDGTSKTYDVISLMANSEPITVQTQVPNWGLIVLALGVVVLAVFALSFVKMRQPGRK